MNTSLPQGPDCWSNQTILYCNHEATFIGDVIVTPQAVTVLAKGETAKPNYAKGATQRASWHITDAFGGYWNPTNGRFVLPRKSVQKLPRTS